MFAGAYDGFGLARQHASRGSHRPEVGWRVRGGFSSVADDLGIRDSTEPRRQECCQPDPHRRSAIMLALHRYDLSRILRIASLQQIRRKSTRHFDKSATSPYNRLFNGPATNRTDGPRACIGLWSNSIGSICRGFAVQKVVRQMEILQRTDNSWCSR